MKTIQCKFTCVSITKRQGWGGNEFLYDAEFQAVTKESYRGRVFKDRETYDAAKADDVAFFAATPSAQLKVSTVAADHFTVGADYYVDLRVIETP